MPPNPIPVRFHFQNNTTFCGPACAQMVLRTRRPGLLDQAALATAIKGVTQHAADDWASSPNGLLEAVNAHGSPFFQHPFRLYRCRTEARLSHILCASIDRGVAPICLVGNDAHWVVVAGYEPVGSPPATIGGFIVLDPIRIFSDSPVMHNDADICKHQWGAGDPGPHVSYADWREWYLFEPVTNSGHWFGQFLAVCAGDPVPFGADPDCTTDLDAPFAPLPAPAPPAPPDMDPPEMDPPPPIGPPVRNITEVEAITAAEEGIRRHGLDRVGDWPGARPDPDAAPLFVARLDRPDRSFYIAPFIGEDHGTPLLVIVDADQGVYLASTSLPGQRERIVGLVDPETFFNRYREDGVPVPGSTDVARLESQRDPLRLVWSPSRESPDRFWPFYELTTEAGRTIYLRIDGMVVTAFTAGHSEFDMTG